MIDGSHGPHWIRSPRAANKCEPIARAITAALRSRTGSSISFPRVAGMPMVGAGDVYVFGAGLEHLTGRAANDGTRELSGEICPKQ